MRITAAVSTTIAAVAYDEAAELLRLEFRNHTVYHYFGVPVAVYDALLGAPSKGSYFNRVIRGAFRYRGVSQGDQRGSGLVVAAGIPR